MPITPISPTDKEKLVSLDASILVNLTFAPTEAKIDGVVVFDGAFFQGGWTGSVLNLMGGGKRLVLTPPTPFAVGQVVTVSVTENETNETFSYIFQTGLKRVTESGDSTLPSLAIVPSNNLYIGYVKDTGEMFVRFVDPLSPEVKLIQAAVVDVGFDPTLNKLIVFFINNGRVYVTTADPGDGPNSILPPGEAETPIKAVAFPFDNVVPLTTGGEGPYATVQTSLFLPVKQAPPVDPVLVAVTGGAGEDRTVSAFPRTLSPLVVSDNPRIVRLPRTQVEPEATLAIGFYVFKTSKDYAGGRLIPEFVPLPAGAMYAEYVDPAPTPGAGYAMLSVYRNGSTTGTVWSAISTPDIPTSFFAGLDVLDVAAVGGEGRSTTFVSVNFPPLKYASPVDPVPVAACGGSSAYQSFGR